MAKQVAVIDIGSNSVRMVIYEKSSRYAFHLLFESKSKVRLSEKAYKNNGNLQPQAIHRTFNALSDFLNIISSFQVKKTFCVATSALRDAPNKDEFISLVRSKLKLNIKVISGEKEAYLGALACANLLPKQSNAISIDIGGGSTEFGYIDSDNINKSFSLELGTVRLKELFFDNDDIKGAKEYIDNKLSFIEDLTPNTLIGIGGTFRAITTSIMLTQSYPLNKVHGFECDAFYFSKHIDKILEADNQELQELGIEKSRFDIIKPGALILQRVFKKLSIKHTITSGAGVREGVYLSDLLRNSKNKFPQNFNTSVRYIIDAHIQDKHYANQLTSLSKSLFDMSYEHIGIDVKYRYELAIASKLYPSGSRIHFFSQNRHTYYLIKSALEYGFNHSQIMLIATLARYAKNKFPSARHVEKYKNLLPDKKTINYLSYIISVSIALLSHRPRNIDFTVEFKDGVFNVDSPNTLYLSQDALRKLSETEDLSLII